MKGKLTLSIDKGIISKTKQYAKVHNKSVSTLVEDYLKSLPNDSNNFVPKKGSVIEELLGVISEFDDNSKSYKEILEEELSKKYGL